LQSIPALLESFRAAGGVFDNLTIHHDEARGVHCRVSDPDAEARVFCPDDLLVDIGHVDIGESGLFIAKREPYGDHADFLDRYFSLHFGRYLVEQFLEEKAAVDALTPREIELLSVISLPAFPASGAGGDLAYVKQRILDSHKLGLGRGGRGKVIMPFVTFLNHDRDGIPYRLTGQGVEVRGRFANEAFACYHRDDSLALLHDHGFGAASELSYSLPMLINLPDGRRLQVRREHACSTQTPEGFPWPVMEESGDTVSLSWFPLYFRRGPKFPARVARSLAETCNIPAELVLHAVYSYNFGQLFHLASNLRGSDNPYVKGLLAGLDVHIQQCTGVFPDGR